MDRSNAHDGMIPTNEPRLSMLAIAPARNKGKGWTVPTLAMERSNQDFIAPAVATARESKGKGGSNRITDDRSKLSRSIHFRGANFAFSSTYITSLVHCRQVQYMLRNWLHLTYPEEWQKLIMGEGCKVSFFYVTRLIALLLTPF